VYSSGIGVHFSEPGISGNARALFALTEQASGSAAITGWTKASIKVGTVRKILSLKEADKFFLLSMDSMFIVILL
jgi:hypothetical protein